MVELSLVLGLGLEGGVRVVVLIEGPHSAGLMAVYRKRRQCVWNCWETNRLSRLGCRRLTQAGSAENGLMSNLSLPEKEMTLGRSGEMRTYRSGQWEPLRTKTRSLVAPVTVSKACFGGGVLVHWRGSLFSSTLYLSLRALMWALAAVRICNVLETRHP